MTRFAAVCAYFNPCGYQSRRRNYNQFRRRIDDSGVPLLTVELQFSSSPSADLSCYSDVLLVKGGDVMWQKERLLQIGIDQLIDDGCDAIVWMDADIVFEESRWPERILKALEQYDYVQSFERLVSHYPGKRLSRIAVAKDRRSFAHGGSWAARADFWRKAPLYQHCILGAADSVMANVFSQLCEGETAEFQWPEDDIVLRQVPPRLRAHAKQWASRIPRPMKSGYVPSVTAHLLPHGTRRNRYYLERWRALAEYDPACDVAIMESGAFKWTCDKPRLKRTVRRYFEARREED